MRNLIEGLLAVLLPESREVELARRLAVEAVVAVVENRQRDIAVVLRAGRNAWFGRRVLVVEHDIARDKVSAVGRDGTGGALRVVEEVAGRAAELLRPVAA